MNWETVSALSGIGVAIVGGVFGIVKGLLGTLSKHLDESISSIKQEMFLIKTEMKNFQLEIAKSYATQGSLEKMEIANTASHATLHCRIDTIHEKIIRVETIQAHCRICSDGKE